MAAASLRMSSVLALSSVRLQVFARSIQRLLSTEGKSKYSEEYFKEAVGKRNMVVFMKGIPSEPMCGFSRLVIQILNMHGVKDYDYYNILEDLDFKEAVKKHSNWPTFPQVYVNGEFIGGSDVLLQMHQNGELVDELLKIGHKSALLKEQN